MLMEIFNGEVTTVVAAEIDDLLCDLTAVEGIRTLLGNGSHGGGEFWIAKDIAGRRGFRSLEQKCSL